MRILSEAGRPRCFLHILLIYLILHLTTVSCLGRVVVTNKFLDALEHIESGRDPNVKPGDGGRSVGILQIQEIYVREANRLCGAYVFSYNLRKDPLAAREMARVVLTHWCLHYECKGYTIGFKELASLHRRPNLKWRPNRLDSEHERNRTRKLLGYLKEH